MSMDLDSPQRSPSPLPVVSLHRPPSNVVEPTFKFIVALDDLIEMPVSFVGPKSFRKDVKERSLLFVL